MFIFKFKWYIDYVMLGSRYTGVQPRKDLQISISSLLKIIHFDEEIISMFSVFLIINPPNIWVIEMTIRCSCSLVAISSWLLQRWTEQGGPGSDRWRREGGSKQLYRRLYFQEMKITKQVYITFRVSDSNLILLDPVQIFGCPCVHSRKVWKN